MADPGFPKRGAPNTERFSPGFWPIFIEKEHKRKKKWPREEHPAPLLNPPVLKYTALEDPRRAPGTCPLLRNPGSAPPRYKTITR